MARVYVFLLLLLFTLSRMALDGQPIVAQQDTANCTYIVGMDATVISASDMERLFAPIFDTFLNENLYATGVVPCNFSLVYLANFEEARAAVLNRSLSYLFGNPSMTSCFSAQFGIAPLATKTNTHVDGTITTSLGISMYVLDSRTDLQTVDDLQGAIVAGLDVFDQVGFIWPMHVLMSRGINPYTFLKQIIFTHDLFVSMHYLDQAIVDVAFVPDNFLVDMSPYVLMMLNVNMSRYRVLGPKIISHPGYASTATGLRSPGLTLSALEDGPIVNIQELNTRKVITQALFNLEALDPFNFGPESTPSFTTPGSIELIRQFQTEVELMSPDPTGGRWQCNVASSLYSSVSCPAGYAKLAAIDFEQSCSRKNMTCPQGSDCMCSPCKIIPPPPSIPYQSYTFVADDGDDPTLVPISERIQEKNVTNAACQRMHVCAKFALGESTYLMVVDQLLEWNVQHGLPRTEFFNFSSSFTTENNEMAAFWEASSFDSLGHGLALLKQLPLGMNLIQIEVNGNQISGSPFLLEVTLPVCVDPNMMASASTGHCYCKPGFVLPREGSLCSREAAYGLATIYEIIFPILAFTLIVSVLVILWLRRQHRLKTERTWRIDYDELIWDDPIQILGQGACGVVTRAQYQGTYVAVKSAYLKGGSHAKAQIEGHGVQGIALRVAPSNLNALQTKPSRFEPKRERLIELVCDNGIEGRATSKTPLKALNPQPCEREPTGGTSSGIFGNVSSATSTKGSRSFRASLQKEIQLLVHLRHPNILSIIGICYSPKGNEALLVMELMGKGTLRNLIYDPLAELDGPLIFSILKDVASGLRYLHLSNPPAMHLDLKPSNLLIDENFRAKVADFGLSNSKERVGSPFWMAPEVLRGDPPTIKADVYSFAIVMYEIFAKKTPYEGEEVETVVKEVANPAEAGIWKRPGVPVSMPHELADMMQECWHQNPARRPTFVEIEQRLKDLDDGPGSVVDKMVAKQKMLREEKKTLEDRAQKLEKHLKDAVQGQLAPVRYKIDADTPVEKIINHLSSMIEGKVPSLMELVHLHNVVVNAVDLHMPVHLSDQLTGSTLNENVKQSIMELLQGPSTTSNANLRRGSLYSVDSTPIQKSVREGEESDFELTLAMIGGVPRPSLRPSFERKLENALVNWNYDVGDLVDDGWAENSTISLITFFFLKMTGLVARFNIDEKKLANFLKGVDNGYRGNPYHCGMHAASVVQLTHMMLQNGGLQKVLESDPLTILSMYIAAAVHDYDHYGLNNDFLIKSGSELALEYNDFSPLENHHAASAFRVLRQPGCNFLEALPKADQNVVRSTIIDLVMNTDMKKHFNVLSQFQVMYSAEKSNKAVPNSELARVSGGSEVKDLGYSPPLRMLMCQVALKCADVGHLAKSEAVHRRWVCALEEELFRQGDMEKKLGIPVSPLMNRDEGGITASQVGFFDIVALPLFSTLASTFPEASPLLEAVQSNYNMWYQIKELTNSK